MEILYILIPVSVMLVLAILGVLWWSIFSGQFEDLEKEGLRVLQINDGKPDDKLEAHQE